MFGSNTGTESSILKNVGKECNDDECPWESILLRSMFLLILACHIPFVFFSGKEAMLIMIDEINRKSISKALQHKLNIQENHDKIS